MSHQGHDGVLPSSHIIATLRQLIDLLDRRVPQVARAGETEIARDAAELRRKAVNRIEELTRAGSEDSYDQTLADAIMSDDGSPRT